MSDTPLKEFSSFHCHSHFSVMDGISLPEEMIRAAKDKGLKSIAITDHGHAHGHADFFLFGKKHGVRTVFGVEAYVISDLEEWNTLRENVIAAKKQIGKVTKDEEAGELSEEWVGKQGAKALRKKGHLVLLATSRAGLANLNQVIFQAHKIGFYGKPRADKKMLSAHSHGLVATTACMGGVISNKCWDFKREEASWAEVVEEAKEYDRIFGRGRFFLEVQFNELDAQRFINDCMVRIHRETGIPLTVTTDSHYTQADDWEAQEILYMLRSNKTLATRGPEWSFGVKQLYIKSPEEMWQSFQKFGGDMDPGLAMEAFQNTILIDGLVEDYEPDTHQRLPHIKGVENPFETMGKRAIEALKARGLDKDVRYVRQLFHELRVIKDKGIANYFLISQSMIVESKKKMLVGAGRGSAAGSLVCYMLGITDLDPIRHELMFERFLDPDRVELPDIDVDFQDPDAVKEILKEMFGEDNVASLSTYGTFQIKGLLKDLGRVHDMDHQEINLINKKIDSELRQLYVNQDKSTIVIKLEDIERVSPTFNKFAEQHPDVVRQLRKLYGRNRHVGRHAAGVIIGDDLPAETSVFSSKGVVQASFTEGIVNKNISAMGFVKFDLLGLATLGVIDHALKLVASRTKKSYEELRESIRECNMDLNDPKVLKTIFHDGNFAGIFQFTEKGIRRLAMRVKPNSFVDVSAITSLYRPGPLGSHMDKLYVDAKNSESELKYDHPLLENILKKTRGCIVFQEQLMQICNVLGKMSMKDVNRVRKVLLKKDKSKSEEFLKREGDELRGKFVTGCAENDLSEKPALEMWEKLLKFGGYGFNKAHSDSYSVITMQTAYLATYYPLEFYAALLTKGQSGAMQDYVSDIKRRGIGVLPVDVNSSGGSHTIEGNDLRLSFSTVLGVGPAAIEKIVKSQPYADFLDYLDRSGVGKTATLPLIRVGAFSSLSNCNNVRRVERAYEKWSTNDYISVLGRDTVKLLNDNFPMVELKGKHKWKITDDDVIEYKKDNKTLWGKGPIVDMLPKPPDNWHAGEARLLNSEKVFKIAKEQRGDQLKLNEEKETRVRIQSVAGREVWEQILDGILSDGKVEDYGPHERVSRENELMGFSVHGSPFEILDRRAKIEAMFKDTVTDYGEFVKNEEEVGIFPVVLKEFKERAQRNGQMFAFMKFGVESGEEFEVPCFSSVWQHIGKRAKKGNVYITTFNRKEEDPGSLILGRPGFAHSEASAQTYFIDVDDVVL